MPDGGKDFRLSAIGGLDQVRNLRLTAAQAQLEQASQPKKAGAAGELEAGKTGTASSGKAREAATQFEALLLQQMLQSMWSSVPKDGLLGSNEEDTYRDMLNEALAKEIADGQGIGIRDVICEEMEKQEKK